MRQMGVPHDTYTFPIINQAIALQWPSNLFSPKTTHCLAIQMGFESDIYFCNTMIEAYVENGFVGNAYNLFDGMCGRDLVTWTSMINGFIRVHDVDKAFGVFRRMRTSEAEPNSVTMIVVMGICSNVLEGRQFHCQVIKNGLLADNSVANAVLKMYGDAGSYLDAEGLFQEIDVKDVVSWNIMISLYFSRLDILSMVGCFREMLGNVDVTLGCETLTLLVSGFAEGGNLCEGEQVHCFGMKSGLCDDILRTNLLDFYAKCGKLECSVQLFGEVVYKNCITWSAMMEGYIQNGCFREAIVLFEQMLEIHVHPTVENLRNLVVAYMHMGSLRLAKAVHGYLIRRHYLIFSYGDIPVLETSILNMYIRCGSISAARICFSRMDSKDLVAWTSMIEGCGTHGLGFEALQLFHQMIKEGIRPNNVTFLSVLSACSHSGLLSEGCEVFYSMKWRYGIEPELSHYTCIVDLLGRSGKIKEALAVIVKLVDLPDSRIWGALLAASRVHEDQKVGEYAAGILLELEPYNTGYYTLFSNMQANAERWAKVEELRKSMKHNCMMRQPGWSFIESNGLYHGFVSGGGSGSRYKSG